jgi:predicted nucleic-acid-binding protein
VIGLDTNVIVRYLAQDDDVQSPLATRLMESLTSERPGFVSSVSLVETTWVLSRAYGASRDEIGAAVEGLLRAAELVVENSDAAYRALAIYRNSGRAEFSDALIAQRCALAGAAATVTFDRRAAREAGMQLLT